MNRKNLTDLTLEELRRRALMEQEDDEDQDDEDDEDDFELDNDSDDKDESSDVSDDFCDMVCALLHSQTQVHIFHLGVRGKGSYAAHKALQGYYEGIDALVDGIIESYQGKYGLLTNYKSFKNVSFKSIKQTISYLKGLNDMIEDKRDCCDDTFIQNQIDTVQELIFSTLYKLRFLE
jgi:DNA-binding ferritin-like protein